MKLRMLGAIVCVLALLLVAEAEAFEFEKLVMPGPVSELHADIEGDCGSCHLPFDRGRQKQLCTVCHEEVAADLKQERGLHGRDPRVRGSRCRDCHSEHRGRDADILGFDRESFQHRFTDFDLLGRHRDVPCVACHDDEQTYRAAPDRCADCHGEAEPHRGRLGDDCASCHNERGWREAKFDHESTGFPLEGGHEQVDCRLCHAGERYKDTPTDCRACHATDDAHAGEFGRDCARCHSPEDWQRSVFDHGAETRFALTHRHADVSCRACHSGPLEDQQLDPGCIACHAADDVHRRRNGTDCSRCHTARGWGGVTFDHDRETDFPLRGRHEGIACQQCHLGDPSKEQLSSDCSSCHESEDAHAGSQGRDCGRCHSEAGWRAGVRFDHEITRFPLLGLHAVESCEACHESTRFRGTERACKACHGSDDAHKGKLGDDCGRCHNPNGWALWRFDHGSETEFSLQGGHEGLNCLACHTRPMRGDVKQASECAACHGFDDVHSGGFGRDCGRCHDEDSWQGARIGR